MIKVLVVDDQRLMRDGIKMLLELAEGIELVAEASDGVEAVASFKAYHPDVVLMDIEMPKLDGIEATRKIRAIDVNARIIVLTTFGQEDNLRRALQSGAQGFLLKAVSGDDLADSIRTAYSGAPVLDSQSTQLLLNSYCALSHPENSMDKGSILSTREVQILKLIAQDQSNRDIAHKLHLAEGTVKNYISQILEKLQVKNRVAAVKAAQKLGVLD